MTTYLADTSAWHRTGATAALRERWSELLLGGSLVISAPVRLELLYSARNPSDFVTLADDLAALPELPIDATVSARAAEVQAALAAQSQHRGPTPVDLWIAAVSEINAVTLVHYDRHFDAIERVTGQPMEWIAPRGTLD